MPKPRDFPIVLPLDGRVILDARLLKELRQRRALSQEAVADYSISQRLCLSMASIKRAEAGKPVLYRTARHLAEFYGMTIEALLPVVISADNGQVIERLLFRTILDSVLASKRGHLIDTQAQPGSGKSKLLMDFAADAEQKGFECIFVHARNDSGLLTALMAELVPGDRVQHIHPIGTAQIGRLIQKRASTRPMMLSIDGMQYATEMLRVVLDTVVAATLASPVIWMLATEQPGSELELSFRAKVDTYPRTVFYLARDSAYASLSV